MHIINLTQHEATAEQEAAGVLPMHERRGAAQQPVERLRELLTFDDLPTPEEVVERAEAIAALAEYSAYLQRVGYDDPDVTHAMIGGAPFLMEPLAAALRGRGLLPVYAFSRRESKEVVQADGATRKVAVFRHLGFVGG